MAHWILVDYENVRPSDFHPDKQPDTNVVVFLGASQNKVPTDLAMALQAFGPRAQYVRCAASGKNALDFHIACYLGELASQHQGDQFHIISADKGFDPLVKHLRGERGVAVTRHDALPTVAPAKKAPSKKKEASGRSTSASAEDIRKALAAAGATRPRKVNTLRNWIDARYPNVNEKEIDRLVANLRSRQWIVVNEDKVSYKL